MYTPAKRKAGQGSERKERKLQILTFIMENTKTDRDEAPHFGTYQIAKAIGLKPTQHLRNILCEMYDEGLILHEFDHARNNVIKSVWYYCENWHRNTEYWDAVVEVWAENN